MLYFKALHNTKTSTGQIGQIGQIVFCCCETMLRIISIIYIIINNIFIYIIIISFGKHRVQKWICPICFCPICPVKIFNLYNPLFFNALQKGIAATGQIGQKQIGQIAFFKAKKGSCFVCQTVLMVRKNISVYLNICNYLSSFAP